MQPEQNTSKNIKKAALAFVGIGLIIALIQLLGFSFIVIDVTGSTDGNLEYTLIESDSGKETVFSTDKNSVRRFIKKGNYEIIVSQSNYNNSFSMSEVPGLLRTTRITTELVPESSREFIGDNPLACTRYIDGVLVSWPCNSNVERGFVHSPATPTTASVNRKITSRTSSSMTAVDIVDFFGDGYVIGKQIYDGGESLALYTLNYRDGLVDDIGGIPLNGLSLDKSYGVSTTNNGYLIYPYDAENIYLLSGPRNLQKIEAPKPGAENTNLYSVQVMNDSVAYVFGNSFTNELGGSGFFPSLPLLEEGSREEQGREGDVFDSGDTSEVSSSSGEVIIISDGQEERYEINFPFNQIRVCDDRTLCVLHQNNLDIYTLEENQLRLRYTLPKVTQIHMNGDSLLLIRGGGVLKFDPETKKGHYVYSLGEYTYCGIKNISNDVVSLCIDNPYNSTRKQSVLSININSPLSNPIDKSTLSLLLTPQVKTLSVYKNYVHISPELGEFQNNVETGEFEYNPDTVKSVNQIIKNKVKELNIDTGLYTVVNPFE
jgi:hypothetical protein